MTESSTTPPRLLDADAITVRYNSTLAVNAVTLRVGSGEMLAVTGPSGAGKTSLLEVCAGVRAPTQGVLTIGGQRVSDRHAAVALRVAFIPQGNALVAVLNALENVAVPLLANSASVTGAREAAIRALSAVGVDDAAGQLVDELSGGQQQRVAVARGLVVRGDVLIADEPTSELDAANRTRIMALLRAEADRGAAVIIATHDPETADFCDAEIRLDEGSPTVVRDHRQIRSGK